MTRTHVSVRETAIVLSEAAPVPYRGTVMAGAEFVPYVLVVVERPQDGEVTVVTRDSHGRSMSWTNALDQVSFLPAPVSLLSNLPESLRTIVLAYLPDLAPLVQYDPAHPEGSPA